MTRIGNTLVYVSSELHTIVLWLGELQFNGKLGSTAIASLQHVFPHKLCIHQPMNVYLRTLVGLSNGNTYWWTGLALLCFSWLYVAFIICCSSVHVSTQIGASQSRCNDQLVGRWRTWTWTTKYLPSRTKQLASTPRLSCDKPGKRVYKDTQAIGRNIMCYNNLQKWIVVAIILLISLSLSLSSFLVGFCGLCTMGTVHGFILGYARLILPCLQLLPSGDPCRVQSIFCGFNTWQRLVFFLGVVPWHGHLCFRYNCWWDSTIMVCLIHGVNLVAFGNVLEP